MEGAKSKGQSDHLSPTMCEMLEVIEHAMSKDPDFSSQAYRLSHTAVLALCGAMGGYVFYLPKASAIKRRLRKEAIYRDYRTGIAISKLVSKYRISQPSVYALIEEFRLESRIQ